MMENGSKHGLSNGKRKLSEETDVRVRPLQPAADLSMSSACPVASTSDGFSDDLYNDLYNDLYGAPTPDDEDFPSPNYEYEDGEYEDDLMQSRLASVNSGIFPGDNSTEFELYGFDGSNSGLDRGPQQNGQVEPRSASSLSLISDSPATLESSPAQNDLHSAVRSDRLFQDTAYYSDEEKSDGEVTEDGPSGRASRNGDDDEDEYDRDSDGEFDEFDDDEVDALLEGSDGYGVKTDKERMGKNPLMKTFDKHILVEKGHHHFEFLPSGWIKVIHQSGMPIYFHRETRICTLSRPYGLGRASLRGHKIPVSAIPCLEYQRAKDDGNARSDSAVDDSTLPKTQNGTVEPSSDDLHSAKLYTAVDHVQKSLLGAVELREYCSKLFEFKVRACHRYRNWKVGRGQIRIAKKVKAGEKAAAELLAFTSGAGTSSDAPVTMVKGAKIITIIRPSSDGKSQITFNLNPANKTSVSILCEYLQHAKLQKPEYQFLELPDSNTPYQAVLTVDGKEEGRGVGASKRLAKSEAAKNGILKLAPELKVVFEARNNSAGNDDDIFDDIVIDDQRVSDIAHKSGHPAPYQVLINALSRQDAHSNATRPVFTSEKKSHLKNLFTMTAGGHTVTYVHQKNLPAKHMCAQLILKAMHPELKYYGDLLKQYGRRLDREKVKKREDQRAITDLQAKGKWGEPNWELLEKLKEVMKTVAPVPLRTGEASRIRY